jgi:hypothetical protein
MLVSREVGSGGDHPCFARQTLPLEWGIKARLISPYLMSVLHVSLELW